MRLELDKVLSNDICHGLMYNLEIEIVYLFTKSAIGRPLWFYIIFRVSTNIFKYGKCYNQYFVA